MRIRGTAVILRDGKVLLVRDRNKKSFSLPGGKREHNETSFGAAVREVYEELGMVSIKAERVFECDYKGRYSIHHVTVIKTNDFPVIKDGELEAFLWWNLKDNIPKYAHVDYIMKKFMEVSKEKS